MSESDFDWPRLIIHQGASSVYTCLPVAASSAEEYSTIAVSTKVSTSIDLYCVI